jgi:hypothetical protein
VIVRTHDRCSARSWSDVIWDIGHDKEPSLHELKLVIEEHGVPLEMEEYVAMRLAKPRKRGRAREDDVSSIMAKLRRAHQLAFEVMLVHARIKKESAGAARGTIGPKELARQVVASAHGLEASTVADVIKEGSRTWPFAREEWPSLYNMRRVLKGLAMLRFMGMEEPPSIDGRQVDGIRIGDIFSPIYVAPKQSVRRRARKKSK